MQDGTAIDDLMDPPSTPVTSNQDFSTAASPGFQCTLTVRYMDEYGLFTVVPFSSGTGKYGLALAATDTVTITSKKQSALVTFPGNLLSIVLTNSASASQEGQRRRYVVPNFGKITGVSIGANSIFNGKDSNGKDLKTSFVMVHFSDQPPTKSVTLSAQHQEEDRHREEHTEHRGY
jgi:hypothetical protein